MKRLFKSLACCVMLTASTIASAQDIFLKPEDAGPEFAVQGEYSGSLEIDGQKVPVGLQVIALGDGKFDAVAYPGGLPGAGWLGTEKHRASGMLQDGVAKFTSGEGMTAEIRSGEVSVKSGSGSSLGSLKKTERVSPTLGAKPPAGAVVLFDGKSADKFHRGQLMLGDLLAADCETREKFGSHTLHIEFGLRSSRRDAGRIAATVASIFRAGMSVRCWTRSGLRGRTMSVAGSIPSPAPLLTPVSRRCHGRPTTWTLRQPSTRVTAR